MDYVASTNMISWVPAQNGRFGWPNDSPDGERVAGLKLGEIVVPKFSQDPLYAGDFDQETYVRSICESFGDDFDERRSEYESTVSGGNGAVPFVMRVTGAAELTGEIVKGYPWYVVPIERVALAHPISTWEFLRLRVVPLAIAAQFKAMAAPGRRIQQLGAAVGGRLIEIGASSERGPEGLRSECLVRADTAEAAASRLADAGLPVRAGDRAFLALPDRMPGLVAAAADGVLESKGTAIAMPPADLRDLFTRAKAASPNFTSQRAIHAADELVEFLASDDAVRQIPDFGHFHDRYVLMATKVTEALDRVAAQAAAGPAPGVGAPDGAAEEPEEGAEETMIHQVEALAVSAVRDALPEGMSIDDRILAEAVTALRAGKHLLLSGPPGTGKSTLAAAICRAVGAEFRTATATADWTTVDTIGAYLPDGHGGLRFEEGIVLQCLDEGAWLIIDEINRADIDKAFGPLFSLLAGTGGSTGTITLPYRRDGQRIEIGWAPTLAAKQTDYAVTRGWRMIGTLNDSDKSSLFTLSFAFLRRFAVIDVGLPREPDYRKLIASRLPANVTAEERELLERAALAVATGPVPLGPAITLDVAEFTRRGITETAAGDTPYDDAVDAFLVALRLYVVPQYEGATSADVQRLLTAIRTVWPTPPADPFSALERALSRGALDG